MFGSRLEHRTLLLQEVAAPAYTSPHSRFQFFCYIKRKKIKNGFTELEESPPLALA